MGCLPVLCVQAFVFLNGCKIGFFRGDIKLLLDDIKELKPTLFAVVPRLLNRIYDKVSPTPFGPAPSPTGVHAAGDVGSQGLSGEGDAAQRCPALQGQGGRQVGGDRGGAAVRGVRFFVCPLPPCRGIIRRNSFWDRLVFRKIQALLGGRVRYLVTGSAPIPKEVLRFMRISLGCQVFEGYGQTEAHAASCLTVPGETSAGHVGPPLPCVMIKLVDVPEMNYFSANHEGEVRVLVGKVGY